MNEIADELIMHKHKIDGGAIIGVCPNCNNGGLFISDEPERICVCNNCGFESKL